MSPKSEGCTKVHSGSSFFFIFKTLQMACYISECPDAEAMSEAESIALRIGPCSWRLRMFWWTWGLRQVLSSESHSQLRQLNSELFALCQLVLTLSPDQLWGVTCSHRKGSEHCPWVTLANRKLWVTVEQDVLSTSSAQWSICTGRSIIHFHLFSVYYWDSVWDSNDGKTYLGKTSVSLIINEEKQGRKTCCLGSCCD